MMQNRKMQRMICMLLTILLSVLSLAAKYDTCGVKPGQYDEHIATHVMRTSGGAVAYLRNIDISRSGYTVYINHFGRTVVLETTPQNAAYRNGFMNAVFAKFGQVITNVRTIQPGIPTHLDFIGADNGSTTIYDLISRAGAPNHEVLTPDPFEFSWVTVDGYQYHVALDIDSPVVSRLYILYPGKTWTDDVFQIQAVILYLALAAVLTVFLVCLLKVPKIIENRKEKSANPFPKE